MSKSKERRLSEAQRQAILTSTNAYMAETGMSQNELAKAVGMSSGYLSDLRAGNWSKISDAQFLKLRAYVSGVDWNIYEESQSFQEIIAACADAHSRQRMVGIAAYTGAGKTTALFTYYKDNPRAHYVLCNFLMKPKDLLHKIADCFGIENIVSKREQTLLDEIAKKVKSEKKRGSLLILDDFGKLGDGCYRMLQLVYDMTEYNCGIVVAGTETLRTYVDSKAAKNKMGFKEIKRRLGVLRGCSGLSSKDVEAVCSVNGLTDAAKLKELKSIGGLDYGTLKQIILDHVSNDI